MKLFASILRYEDEFGYVLVTPVEKWQINVEDSPLIIVAADDIDGLWRFVTNVATEYELSEDYCLYIDDKEQPCLKLSNGLHARLDQAVYYQLANAMESYQDQFGLRSAGQFYAFDG